MSADHSLELNKGRVVDYRIRTSPRARNLRLTLFPQDGLTVVVPLDFDLRRIPGIVEKKRGWIEAHLRRFADISGAVVRAPVVAVKKLLDN